MIRYIEVRRDKISPDVYDFVLNRDRNTCRYCGSKSPPFHLDHVYPVAKGGETSVNNLVTACRKCNSKKGTSIIFPKPVGHFDNERTMLFHSFMAPVVLGVLISTLTLFAISEGDLTWQKIESFLIILCWIPIAIGLFRISVDCWKSTMRIWRNK